MEEINVEEKVAMTGRINERVLSVYSSYGQYTLKLAQRLKIQKLLTELTSLISFFFRLNEDATNKKYQTRHCQEYFQYSREFFKEITRQPNSKDGFSQVRNYLGNKFSAILSYYFHQSKIYHIIENLSRFSLGRVVYSIVCKFASKR